MVIHGRFIFSLLSRNVIAYAMKLFIFLQEGKKKDFNLYFVYNLNKIKKGVSKWISKWHSRLPRKNWNIVESGVKHHKPSKWTYWLVYSQVLDDWGPNDKIRILSIKVLIILYRTLYTSASFILHRETSSEGLIVTGTMIVLIDTFILAIRHLTQRIVFLPSLKLHHQWRILYLINNILTNKSK